MTSKGLSYVASALGTPICIDKAIDSVKKAGIARICVELYPETQPMASIPVILEDNSTIEVQVKYPWKKATKPLEKRWVVKSKSNEELVHPNVQTEPNWPQASTLSPASPSRVSNVDHSTQNVVAPALHHPYLHPVSLVFLM